MPRKRRHLVVQHLENMHYKLLESYQPVLRDVIKGRNGVYALYKGGLLYYVGLATNLRSRLRYHLRDRHEGRWDKFSLYITETEKPLRELEALVLRIAKPKGNRATSRLASSRDLKSAVGRAIRRIQLEERRILIGPSGRRRSRSAKKKRGARAVGLVRQATPLRMTYRGQTYRASLRRDGTIKFQGTVYGSPTGAACAVRKTTNGWHWWMIKRGGEWVRLKELRK